MAVMDRTWIGDEEMHLGWLGKEKSFSDVGPTPRVKGRVDDRKGILNGKTFGNKGRGPEAQRVKTKDFPEGINALKVSRCPNYGVNAGPYKMKSSA